MTLLKLLFSFTGRINRSTYALYQVSNSFLLLMITFNIGMYVIHKMALYDARPMYFLTMYLPHIHAIDALWAGISVSVAVVYVILFFWASYALAVKRSHDLDQSAFYPLWLLIPLVNIWFSIVLLFFQGTQGDNHYGPDPLIQAQSTGLSTRNTWVATGLLVAVLASGWSLYRHVVDMRYLNAIQGATDNSSLFMHFTGNVISVPNNKIKQIRHWLKYGANADSRFELDNNRTPLMKACINNQLNLAKLLLKYGANVNLQDSDGLTALFYATTHGDGQLVQLLIRHHANINIKDNAGNTALAALVARLDGDNTGLLHKSIGSRQAGNGTIYALLRAEYRENKLPVATLTLRDLFILAVKYADRDTLQRLASSGDRINVTDFIPFQDNPTELKWLRFYLAKGGKLGDDVLCHAIAQGVHLNMVTVLVQGHANVNVACNRTGKTPLQLARAKHADKTARFLLTQGADSNGGDKNKP